MKKLFSILALAAIAVSAYAQKPVYKYTEATDLTIVGKLMPGKTSNPYHRIDTVKYKGFTKGENFQVRMTAGMSCTFRTDSKSISILTEYGEKSFPTNTMGFAARGYDLYVRQADGSWLWAAAGVASDSNLDKPFTLVTAMDGSEHEFLLYFPLLSEVYSIKIGVEEGSSLTAAPNPFRHRVAIWGSSFTHGISTSRAGMAYPAQFARATGIQLLPLGCSGNCKMQTYFADALVDVDAEAFIFDSFSNPDAKMIRERLVPFIDRMIAAHPGKPLIFQQTIYRERNNYNTISRDTENAKIDMAEAIFKEIKATKEGREKYKDVYFVHPSATAASHETTVDGVHPDDHGYTLWAQSLVKPVTRILKKYGIQ